MSFRSLDLDRPVAREPSLAASARASFVGADTLIEAAFRAHPDAVVVFDASARIVRASQEARSLLRISGDPAGRSIADILRAGGAGLEEAAGAVDALDQYDALVDIRGVLTALSVRRVRDRDGRLVGGQLVARGLDMLDHVARSGAGEARFRFAEAEGPVSLGGLERRCRDLAARIAKARRAHGEGRPVAIVGEVGTGKSALARSLVQAPVRLVRVDVDTLRLGGIARALRLTGLGHGDTPRALLIEDLDGLGAQEIADLSRVLQAVSGGPSPWTVLVTCQPPMARPDIAAFLGTLGGARIALPPLRDAPDLLEAALDLIEDDWRTRSPALAMPDAVRATLEGYAFPGNLKELSRLASDLALAAQASGGAVDLADLPDHIAPAPAEESLKAAVERFESALIERAVRRHGSQRRAALALGVNDATIVRKRRRGRGVEVGAD